MTSKNMKQRAPRNRTIDLSSSERNKYKRRLIKIERDSSVEDVLNKTVHQDVFEVLDFLPEKFVDLVFVDPPYNLTKTFNLNVFKKIEIEKYEKWLTSWISKMPRAIEA